MRRIFIVLNGEVSISDARLCLEELSEMGFVADASQLLLADYHMLSGEAPPGCLDLFRSHYCVETIQSEGENDQLF